MVSSLMAFHFVVGSLMFHISSFLFSLGMQPWFREAGGGKGGGFARHQEGLPGFEGQGLMGENRCVDIVFPAVK